jgi:hypothetical protein
MFLLLSLHKNLAVRRMTTDERRRFRVPVA